MWTGGDKLRAWRQAVACILIASALPTGGAAPDTAPSAATRPAQAAGTYRQWVADLTDDSMEGRGLGTKGLVRARDYIAHHFQAMGLKPAFAGAFTQPLEIPYGVAAEHQSLAILDPEGRQIIQAKAEQDFSALGFSASGPFGGPAVFVGYGIVDSQRKYDSYRGAGGNCLRGKVAVAFRYEPQDQQGRSRWASRSSSASPWSLSAGLLKKARDAAGHGAAALLVVNPPSQNADPSLRTIRGTGFWGREKIPVLHIRLRLFKRMLARAGRDPELAVRKLQALADSGEASPEPLPGVFLKGRVELKPFRVQAHNVAAVVPGAGKLAEEVIVVGAHYDHLGYRERPSRSGKRVICPGADDNASGVAGVLMLAKRFSERTAGRADKAPARERRTLVFVAFTGEEAGLVGSAYFARHVEQLGLKGARLVAMVNLDMIGRLKPDGLRVWGVGSADRWGEIVARAARQAALAVTARDSAMTGSDHISFYTRKVPVLHVNTGRNRDIHSPRDTPDKINAAGAVRVVEFVEAALEQLWTDPEPPAYAGAALMSRLFGGPRTYLGIQAKESDGCLVTRVLDGAPAAEAGLKGGDVIVAWNGQPVQSVSGLLARLWAAKPGQEVKITFRRDGKLVEATVTLGRR